MNFNSQLTLDSPEIKKRSSIGIDTTFIDLARHDNELIQRMKETISYQQTVLSKREKLLFAIINNVQYLLTLHKSNKEMFEQKDADLKKCEAQNKILQERNEALIKERDSLMHCKTKYENSQAEIADFVIQ